MPPRMPQFTYIARRGFTRGFACAMRDPGWMSSVGSLFGVLFVSQIFLLLALSVHAGLILLKEQTDIRMEVLETAQPEQVRSLIVELQNQPFVEDVLYVTKAQAYAKQRERDKELIAFLEQFKIENPFPETIGVRLQRLEDYPRLVKFLQNPLFASVVNPSFLSQTTDQEDQINRLMAATIAARSFIIVAIGIIACVLLFVLVELVRRRAVLKSEEILVQQLVGATPLAILLPFGVEVLTLLFFALALALFVTVAAIIILPFAVPGLAAGGLFTPWVMTMSGLLHTFSPFILGGELLLLPILAFGGAFFGLWPRLRIPTLSTLT